MQQLVQNARQFGMNLPNPAAYEELDSTEGEFVRQKMKFYVNQCFKINLIPIVFLEGQECAVHPFLH